MKNFRFQFQAKKTIYSITICDTHFKLKKMITNKSNSIYLYISSYTDSSNDGHLGLGTIIFNAQSQVIFKASRFIDYNETITEHIGHYMSLINGLWWLNENGHNNQLTIIRSDSDIIIHQMNKEWKVKNEQAEIYFKKANKMLLQFPEYRFSWLPEFHNRRAKKLAIKAVVENKTAIIQ